ncbi:glutathione S-transferase family protein [Reyranella sp.]|uniref:glutathione S-transferase family protein n=1 Tax=Reyranella sp. TaxID=1929291 RepID=UPI00273052C8|nr:glutathione S-transferase family protein [Reyranella sp.]MDP2378513.1 glutathione S-transferase family protein [Reyranella sp.]
MLTLYDYMDSGNGYKVRLVLAHLGLPYKLVLCDILKGETRTPEFLKRNPNGRIPTLQLEDGSHIFESGAIIWYLAEGTPLAPKDRKARAETLQWMFFEQYSHEPYIAVARFWKHYLPKLSPLQEMDLPNRMKGGYAALDIMEKHLSNNNFFVGGSFGLADIALYAYTHVAHEGEFDLSKYPGINAWMARVASQPKHITISHKN